MNGLEISARTLAMSLACGGFAMSCNAQEDAEPARQLLPNPDFAEDMSGWFGHGFELIKATAGGPERTVKLTGPEPGSERRYASLGVMIREVPTLRELRMTAHARTVVGADSKFELNAIAYGADRQVLGAIRTPCTADLGGSEIAVTWVAPEEATHLGLYFVRELPGTILLRNLSLIAGHPNADSTFDPAPPPSLHGPGVILANAGTTVRGSADGETGVCSFPVPNRYGSQIPLTFEVLVEPASALRGWRWRERKDGCNVICEVEVEAPADRDVQVRWQSLVFVGPWAADLLPDALEPDHPEEITPWLRATACVQSDDPAIRAKARELAEGCRDVEEYVVRAARFTSRNKGTGESFRTLDASSAMGCGGSCTSRANLCAALLRAHGIAARTQAHLPTWANGLYEHWLVEYWHPGAGWTWVEPTLGQMQPEPWSLVVLNVAGPADEDLAFDDRIRHSGVMQGVAYRAVHDIEQPLARGGRGPLNFARAMPPLIGDAEDFESLSRAAAKRFERLRAAALEGQLLPCDGIHEALDSRNAKRLEQRLSNERE